jgi:small GTP-binding protein
MEDPVRPIKVVAVGDSGIGKTCLTNRLINNSFSDQEQSTVGAGHMDWRGKTAEGEPLNFDFWDTAGQEMYRSLVPTYCRDADIGLLCYSVDSRPSFDSLECWHETLLRTAPKVRVVVVATKLDLGGRLVTESDAAEKAIAFKADICETSAKTGAGIEELRTDLIQLGVIVRASRQSRSHSGWSSSNAVEPRRRLDSPTRPCCLR